MGSDMIKSRAGGAESFVPVHERWERLQPELDSRGIAVQRVLHESRNWGYNDPFYLSLRGRLYRPRFAAIMRLNRTQDAIGTQELTAMFTASGLAIADLATLDGGLSHDFCVWFDGSENTLPPQAPVTAGQIEDRLESLSRELSPWNRAVDFGMVDEGYEAHGSMAIRQPDHTGSEESGMTLDLGPWGWTRWELGDWDESLSYIDQDKTTLDISVSSDASGGMIVGQPRPEIEYKFIPIGDPRPLDSVAIREIVVAAVATYALAPFINAFMTKAGEDCYQSLRAIISQKAKPDERISIIDKDADSELVFRGHLPDEAIRQLALMDPKLLRRHTAEWNPETESWEISRELRPKKSRRKSVRRSSPS